MVDNTARHEDETIHNSNLKTRSCQNHKKKNHSSKDPIINLYKKKISCLYFFFLKWTGNNESQDWTTTDPNGVQESIDILSTL